MATTAKKLIAASILASVATLALYGCISSGPHAVNSTQVQKISIPGTGLMVYAAGDIADCRNLLPTETAAAKTAALIAAGLLQHKDAAVLTLGDNTYPVGLPIEFSNCYQPTWGQFKKSTYPSPGNHDYYTPAAIGYYAYFDDAAGPARRGYYSIELGSWHIISLNSNLPPVEHQVQLAWLKEDLMQHKTPCTLAYWHHPLTSSGGHGNNDQMLDVWEALQEARADVVLASHDHDYERFAPLDTHRQKDEAHGIRQFVVGTGGARLGPLSIRKPFSEVSNNSTHGVLKLELKKTGYEWELLPVAGSQFSDRGAALCH
jgi:3',5'-cyclic AMP phosphodiesterase CpdA